MKNSDSVITCNEELFPYFGGPSEPTFTLITNAIITDENCDHVLLMLQNIVENVMLPYFTFELYYSLIKYVFNQCKSPSVYPTQLPNFEKKKVIT